MRLTDYNEEQEYINSEHEYLQILERLDAIDASADVEGFFETVTIGLRTVKGFFKRGLLNLIGKMPTSEIWLYTETYNHRLVQVFGADFEKIKNATAYKPSGMKISYRNASEKIAGIYNDLGMMEASVNLNKALQSYYANITRNNKEPEKPLRRYRKQLNIAAKIRDNGIDLLKQTTGKVSSDPEKAESVMHDKSEETVNTLEPASDKRDFEELTPENVDNYKFHMLFKDLEEYRYVYGILKGERNSMEEARSIYNEIEKIDTVLGDIENWHQNVGDRDTGLPEDLPDLIRTIAWMTTHYGFAVATQMRLEHNFILTNQNAYKQVEE